MKKSLFTILCCLLCSFVLFSCNSFLGNNGETSLSVQLPYGSARDVVSKSYLYKITFTHESGTITELEGESGQSIKLNPAESGEYRIAGEAYNAKSEVIFKGETTARVEDGKDTKVILEMNRVMYEIEGQTEHMTLIPDKKGIKIILNTVSGEADWNAESCSLYEVGTGTCLELTTENIPTSGKKSILYYPFTQKGKQYKFNLLIVSEQTYLNETASCTAGGGDDSYFDYSNADYKNAKIELDSSSPDKDTMKVTEDVTKLISSEKISEGKLLDVGIVYSVWAGKNDWSIVTNWGWGDILTSYTEENMPVNFNSVLEGLDLWSASSNTIASKLEESYYWFATANVRFRLKDFPNQDFTSPTITSDTFIYKKVKRVSSDHVTVETDEKGIKATFNWKEGDGAWDKSSYLESADGKYQLNFKENEAPTAEKPSITYYIGLTDADTFYEYNFVLKTADDIVTATETLGCLAGGGNAGLVNIPDNWDGYEFGLNDYNPDMRLSCNTDIGNSVFNFSSETISDFVTNIEHFSFDLEVYAGEYDAGNRLTVFNKRQKAIYSEEVSSGSGNFTTKTDSSALLFLVNSSYPVAFNNYASGEMFGRRTKWSTRVVFNIGIKNTDTILSLPEMIVVKNYEGTSYEGEYLQCTEVIDTSNGWSLYCSCPEAKKPVYTVESSSSNGIVISVSDLDSEFENEKKYKFQLRLKVTPNIAGTRPYGYEGEYSCTEEGMLYYEMYDNDMMTISQMGPITSGAGESFPNTSATFVPAKDKTYFYGISILKPGVYTLSDIALN